MISSAYQYYLSEYGRREMSRYDAHKKSELRSEYNNIVRINKKTPLYKVDLSESTQRLLIDLKEHSRTFSNRLYEIFGTKDYAGNLQRKTAYSSRPDILEVEYIGDDEVPDDLSYSIKINRLASPQINTGDFVPSDGLGLLAGNYSFDLNVSNNAYEFQFKVTENSTNLSLQEKLARLINRSNIGITADVIRDANGSSALEVRSLLTGASLNGRIFEFEENGSAEKSGSIEYLGLNKMRKASSDASFEINGQESSATSNSFTIEKSFKVTLNAVTQEDETVSITSERSYENIYEQLNLFAETYNSLYSVADHAESDNPAGKKLMRELDAISGGFNGALETLGLLRNEEGLFTIDEALVIQASKDGTLDNKLPELMDYQKSLLLKTQLISVNPFEYVNKTLVAYPNPVHPVSSPYQTSIYAGILLNGYI